MKLYQLIEEFDENNTISYGKIKPYVKLLYTYYHNQCNGEPILMITDVFNSTALGIVTTERDFQEALEDFLEGEEGDIKEYKREEISANSILLKTFFQ